jgi:hypothetical protein
LQLFKSSYEKGSELARHPSRVDGAISHLSRALELDEGLAGGRGERSASLRKKLATVHFIRGVDARVRKSYAQAYRDFKRTQELYPNQDSLPRVLRDLELEAKRLFEIAYVLHRSNPERSVEHCITVLGMVSPGQIYHSKCKVLLNKLEHGPDGGTRLDSGY